VLQAVNREIAHWRPPYFAAIDALGLPFNKRTDDAIQLATLSGWLTAGGRPGALSHHYVGGLGTAERARHGVSDDPRAVLFRDQRSQDRRGG
jgi:hypothetical protein